MSRSIEDFSPADSILAAKVPRAVADRLREAARTHDRTLSGQIRRVLREWANEVSADEGPRASEGQ
jgi:hypothetical protein